MPQTVIHNRANSISAQLPVLVATRVMIGNGISYMVLFSNAFLCMQTAHEPSYLVKHLLGGLPPVVDRVRLMRKGQGPNGSIEDNNAKMAQSQVCSVGWCLHMSS